MPVTGLCPESRLYSKSRVVGPQWIQNLEHAHKSVSCHGKLRLLNLSGCSKLLHHPDVLQCKRLQRLVLAYCSKLWRFPNIPDKNQSLRELDLKGTSIEKLPASIENLVSLKRMDLIDCKKLSILLSSIYRLRNLEELVLNGCSKLINTLEEGIMSGSCVFSLGRCGR